MNPQLFRRNPKDHGKTKTKIAEEAFDVLGSLATKDQVDEHFRSYKLPECNRTLYFSARRVAQGGGHYGKPVSKKGGKGFLVSRNRTRARLAALGHPEQMKPEPKVATACLRSITGAELLIIKELVGNDQVRQAVEVIEEMGFAKFKATIDCLEELQHS